MFFLIPKVAVILVAVFGLAAAFRRWRATTRRRLPVVRLGRWAGARRRDGSRP